MKKIVLLLALILIASGINAIASDFDSGSLGTLAVDDATCKSIDDHIEKY